MKFLLTSFLLSVFCICLEAQTQIFTGANPTTFVLGSTATVVIPASQGAASPYATNGIVFWDKFDENGGTDTVDSIQGIHQYVNYTTNTFSGAGWGLGVKGASSLAFGFGGAGSSANSIVIQNSILNNLTNNFTVETWASYSGVNGAETAVGDFGGPSGWLIWEASSVAQFYLGGVVINDTQIIDGGFHFYCLVQSNSVMYGFRDGQNIGSVSTAGLTASSGNGVGIGQLGSLATFFMSGCVDDLMIFTNAQTPAQIQSV